MFIDPEAALPFEDVLAIVWKRDPDMHRRVLVIAERLGRSVEETAWLVYQRWLTRVETDPAEREAFFRRLDWMRCPYGVDPLLIHDREE